MDFAELKERVADKWESVVSSLEDRGVPNPRIVLPVVIAAAILASAYLLLSGVQAGTSELTVKVLGKDGEPLDGATVTLLVDGKRISTKPSAGGIAKFSNVPGGTATLHIEAGGYANYDQPVRGKGIETAQLTAAAKQAMFSVNVQNDAGDGVSGAEVTINISGSTLTKTTSPLGEASFDLPPGASGKATISITHSQFKPDTETKDLSEGSVTITLTPLSGVPPTIGGKGRVIVRVSDDNGAVQAALIYLYNAKTSANVGSKKTDSSGAASFELEQGTSFYAVVTAGGYATYDGKSGEKRTVAETTTVTILLRKLGADEKSKITITALDERDNRISGVDARLFSATTNAQLAAAKTDANGVVSFDVAKGASFYARLYKPGYLPASVNGIGAGDSVEARLETAAAGSTALVKVHATLDGADVAGAKAAIYSSDGSFLGVPEQSTKANGIAEFTLPAGGRIFASVQYGAFSGQSSVYQVENNLAIEVALEGEAGSAIVTARDFSTRTPVQGANVSYFFGAESKGGCSTDAKGSCTLQIRAGKEAYVTVGAGGYENYTTAAFTLSAGEKRALGITLVPTALAGANFVKFLGFYDKGKKVKELAPASDYTAKFLFNLKSGFNASGVFIRLGDKSGVADDAAGIAWDGIDFSGLGGDAKSRAVLSKSYLPGASCDADKNTVPGEGELAKWVQFGFAPGFATAREVAVPIHVKTSAKAGDSLPFFFRAFAEKGGRFFRNPLDTQLGENASIAALDGCYAASDSASAKIAATQMECDGDVCFSLALNKTFRSGFESAIGENFTVDFDMIYEGDSLASPQLRFTAPLEFSKGSASLDGSAVPVQLGNGTATVLPAKLESGNRLNGSITARSLHKGAGIEIKAELSDKGTVLKTFSILLDVTGNRVFAVTFSPATLAVNKEQDVTVTALSSEGSAVTDATVSLYECDKGKHPLGGAKESVSLRGTGAESEGADGIYVLTSVSPVSIGKIGVQAKQPDFRTYKNCGINAIATEFLSTDPSADAGFQFTYAAKSDDALPLDPLQISALSKTLHVESNLDTEAAVTLKLDGTTCPGIGSASFELSSSSFKLSGNKKSKDVSITLSGVSANLTIKSNCELQVNGNAGASSITAFSMPVRVKITVPQPAVPVVLSVPSAPRSLKAVARTSSINLTWVAPLSNGGSSVTNYEIYRGTSAGGETSLDEISGSCTNCKYTDGNDLVKDQTYYYKVSARNDIGEGANSSEASATAKAGVTNTCSDLIDRYGSIIGDYDRDGDGKISSTECSYARDDADAGRILNREADAVCNFHDQGCSLEEAVGTDCTIDKPSCDSNGQCTGATITYNPKFTIFEQPKVWIECGSIGTIDLNYPGDYDCDTENKDTCWIKSYTCASSPHYIWSKNPRTDKKCRRKVTISGLADEGIPCSSSSVPSDMYYRNGRCYCSTSGYHYDYSLGRCTSGGVTPSTTPPGYYSDNIPKELTLAVNELLPGAKGEFPFQSKYGGGYGGKLQIIDKRFNGDLFNKDKGYASLNSTYVFRVDGGEVKDESTGMFKYTLKIDTTAKGFKDELIKSMSGGKLNLKTDLSGKITVNTQTETGVPFDIIVKLKYLDTGIKPSDLLIIRPGIVRIKDITFSDAATPSPNFAKPAFIINNYPYELPLDCKDGKSSLKSTYATAAFLSKSKNSCELTQNGLPVDSSTKTKVELTSITNVPKEVKDIFSADAISKTVFTATDWKDCVDYYCTCDAVKTALNSFKEKVVKDKEAVAKAYGGNIESIQKGDTKVLETALTFADKYKAVNDADTFSESTVIKAANLDGCGVLDEPFKGMEKDLSGQIRTVKVSVNLKDGSVQVTPGDIPGVSGYKYLYVKEGIYYEGDSGTGIQTLAQRYAPECVGGDPNLLKIIYGADVSSTTAKIVGEALSDDAYSCGGDMWPKYAKINFNMPVNGKSCEAGKKFIAQSIFTVPGYERWGFNTVCTYAYAYPKYTPNDFQQKFNYSSLSGTAVGAVYGAAVGTAAGVTAGAIIGTGFFPGPGTAVGAAVGILGGMTVGAFAGAVSGMPDDLSRAPALLSSPPNPHYATMRYSCDANNNCFATFNPVAYVPLDPRHVTGWDDSFAIKTLGYNDGSKNAPEKALLSLANGDFVEDIGGELIAITDTSQPHIVAISKRVCSDSRVNNGKSKECYQDYRDSNYAGNDASVPSITLTDDSAVGWGVKVTPKTTGFGLSGDNFYSVSGTKGSG